ncbi:MAG: amidohydrolase family protein [Rhodospirillales bacterium]
MDSVTPDLIAAAGTRLSLVDCDIHPKLAAPEDLKPFLSRRWWEHLTTIGPRQRHGFHKGVPYPKAQPLACRRDAWPPGGGPPGSDVPFIREQLLDLYGIDFAVMNPLAPTGQGDTNAAFSAAMASANNDWQVEAMVAAEPRLRASVVVPYEDGPAAAAEIRRRAGDRRFAHVLMLSRTAEPMGQRRYWPVFEAACEAGLPLGIHVFGYSGWPMTNGGFPSFYLEEGVEHAASTQALVASLIFEGVFARFPTLRILLIEAGFAWIPALAWRLDRIWEKARHGELQDVREPPSAILKRHFWVSTQPVEEPPAFADLETTLDWIGWDRVLFASDYPHWDFDDPRQAIPRRLGEARRRMILSGNGRAFSGI